MFRKSSHDLAENPVRSYRILLRNMPGSRDRILPGSWQDFLPGVAKVALVAMVPMVLIPATQTARLATCQKLGTPSGPIGFSMYEK